MPLHQAAGLQNPLRVFEEFRKNGVAPDSSEPVRRIRRIRFHPMDDAVPVAALSRGYLLRDRMTFSPASNTEQ